MDFSFLYSSLDSKISFKRLFAYWLCFLLIGMSLMTVITPMSPEFVERKAEIIATENACSTTRLIETGLAFITETVIFFILPYKWKGRRGAMVGISAWILLHMISLSIPIAVYIAFMGYFYYRCLEIGRWKEIAIFHGFINSLAILSCVA